MIMCSYLYVKEPTLWEPQKKKKKGSVILPSSRRIPFQPHTCRKSDAHEALSCLKCFWRDEPFGRKVWEPAVQRRRLIIQELLAFLGKQRWIEREMKKHHVFPWQMAHTLKGNSHDGWARLTIAEVLLSEASERGQRKHSNRGLRGQSWDLRTCPRPKTTALLSLYQPGKA